jgi:hypothetical protein
VAHQPPEAPAHVTLLCDSKEAFLMLFRKSRLSISFLLLVCVVGCADKSVHKVAVPVSTSGSASSEQASAASSQTPPPAPPPANESAAAAPPSPTSRPKKSAAHKASAAPPIASVPDQAASASSSSGSQSPVFSTAGAGSGEGKQRKAAKKAVTSNPATDDLRAALTSEMQKLNVGKIDYNPPADMKVDEATLVSARIYRDKDAQVSSADLLGNGPITQSELKVADNMVVSLSAAEPSDFEIKPVAPGGDNQEQFIEENGHANWVWSVKPLKGGEKHLLLVAAVVLHIQGLTETKTINTFNTTITVKVVPHPWQKVGSFIAANWQWLWTTLLVPMAGWLFRRRMKHSGRMDDETNAQSSPHKPTPEQAKRKSA